jgi:hypothetical protein
MSESLASSQAGVFRSFMPIRVVAHLCFDVVHFPEKCVLLVVGQFVGFEAWNVNSPYNLTETSFDAKKVSQIMTIELMKFLKLIFRALETVVGVFDVER